MIQKCAPAAPTASTALAITTDNQNGNTSGLQGDGTGPLTSFIGSGCRPLGPNRPSGPDVGGFTAR